MAVGIGFAPFLAKQPLSVAAGASLLASGGGVALVIAGAVAVLAGHRRRTIALGALAVTVIVVAGCYVVAPAVMVTNAPIAQLDRRPADVGLAAIDVTLATADGETLAGWYVASQNGAAVVLLHGAGSTRSDVLDHAAVLAGAGFGVLLVDARGHGASTGDAMERGWHGDDDVAAATRYLADRPDVDPNRIGAVGISIGGEEAIGAAASDARLRAVVAEGVTARTGDDLTWLSARYGWRGTVQESFEQLRDVVTVVLATTFPPIALADAIAASGDVPFLLITAGDIDDEAFAATALTAAAPDRVTTWQVPDAGHADAFERAPDDWPRHVLGFLQANLLDARGGR